MKVEGEGEDGGEGGKTYRRRIKKNANGAVIKNLVATEPTVTTFPAQNARNWSTLTLSPLQKSTHTKFQVLCPQDCGRTF